MKWMMFGLAFSLHVSAVAAPVPAPNERLQQRAAVDAIRRLGGKVFYDYQRPDPNRPNAFDPLAKPKNPKAFHRVVRVGLRGTKVTDDDLKRLSWLPHLENLDLADTAITGAGLAHLRGLKNLRVLDLWKVRVDDRGLEHLKGLTRLWLLLLDETGVTDAGVAHLKGLTGLEEWLGLVGTKVTDEGLKHLEGLKKLRNVNLRLTPVTAAGVGKLKAALPGTTVSYGR